MKIYAMVPKGETYTEVAFLEKPKYSDKYPQYWFRIVEIWGKTVEEVEKYGLYLPNNTDTVYVFPPFVNIRVTKKSFLAPRKALHNLVTAGALGYVMPYVGEPQFVPQEEL